MLFKSHIMLKLLTNRNFYSVALAVVISFAFVAIMVNGATTISSNINTGGTLTVSGDSTLTGDVFASSTMAVTGQASFYDQVVLDSASSDPTGVSAGAIYWDTTNEVIRVFDGIDWNTVASSTDAAGGLILAGDGQGVRFNTIANAYMALGTTTLPVVAVDAGNAILHVNATTSASVPLVIIGKDGYGGNLFNVYNYLQTEVFSLDPAGNASTTILSTTANVLDALVVSGYATTSGTTGNFATEGTLTVTGATTLTGALTANGNATFGDAAGDSVTVVGQTFSVAGLATTTAVIADDMATTTIGTLRGSALGIGTSTPELSSKLAVSGTIYADDGSATTSLILSTSSETIGSCIQMKATDGTAIRIYATTTPGSGSASGEFMPLVIEAGTCK